MRRLTLPLVLGLAHGAADGAAGLLLGGLPRALALEQVGILVLLYNALAFGGQPLLGLLTDRLGRPRVAAQAGLVLLCAALLAATEGAPYLAVVLAGMGSACFHVGGGALALCATQGRAAGPGLFAAPGVVGLALGGTLAAGGYTGVWPFLLPLLALVAALAALDMPVLPYATQPADKNITTRSDPAGHTYEVHDLVMLVLLAAIALRSAVWSSLQYLLLGRSDVLIAMAVAAAGGKVLGGVLADRLGWRRYTLAALMLAAPLLALGGRNLFMLLPGVALLQSATPAALAATARLLPRAPSTAAGLALGLAIAIGGVPSAGGLSGMLAAPLVLVGILAAAALAMWWALPQIVRLEIRD